MPYLFRYFRLVKVSRNRQIWSLFFLYIYAYFFSFLLAFTTFYLFVHFGLLTCSNAFVIIIINLPLRSSTLAWTWMMSRIPNSNTISVNRNKNTSSSSSTSKTTSDNPITPDIPNNSSSHLSPTTNT